MTSLKPLAKAVLTMLLCSCLWFVGGLAAQAQTDSTTASAPSMPSPELNATDIPSEKVDQFVLAYLEVVALIDDRTEELQRAETEAESWQLQQTIEADAFTAIEEAGLSRRDYFQLLGLANSDPEFRDRVLAQLEERDR